MRAAAWRRAAAVAVVVIGLDQLTKALVRSHIERGGSDAVLPGVDLVNVRNSGVAFGLFADGGALVLVLTLAALAALLSYFATHATKPGVWLPTGLLLGGALGNLLDRVRGEAVTDFVDLPLWPAFNLADVSITVGVIALLWVIEASR